MDVDVDVDVGMNVGMCLCLCNYLCGAECVIGLLSWEQVALWRSAMTVFDYINEERVVINSLTASTDNSHKFEQITLVQTALFPAEKQLLDLVNAIITQINQERDDSTDAPAVGAYAGCPVDVWSLSTCGCRCCFCEVFAVGYLFFLCVSVTVADVAVVAASVVVFSNFVSARQPRQYSNVSLVCVLLPAPFVVSQVRPCQTR